MAINGNGEACLSAERTRLVLLNWKSLASNGECDRYIMHENFHQSNEAKSFNGSLTIRSNSSLKKTVTYIKYHRYQSYCATNVMTSDKNRTLMFTVTKIEGLGAARSSKTSYKTISHFHPTIESLDNELKGKKDSTGSVQHR